jgi:hypothetical protein
LDKLAFAAIAHPGFQKPPQIRKGLWQCPVLQGSRLIECARLLFKQCQIMQGIEDELVTPVAAFMPGDLGCAANDDHLVHKAFYEDILEAIGRRRRIIVHAIAYQARRRDFRQPLAARFKRNPGQSTQHTLIG